MTSSEDNSETSKPTPAASDEPTAAGETSKPEAAKAEPPADTAPGKITYLQPYTGDTAQAAASEAPKSRPRLRRYASLAASLALSAVIGGLAGAAVTITSSDDEPSTAAIAAINANRALRDSLTKLESEVATLRTGMASAQRTTGTQIGKLSERIDRTEKAQVEPTAKLAKVMERSRSPRASRAAVAAGRDAGNAAGDRRHRFGCCKAGRQAAAGRGLAAARRLWQPRRGREP